MSAPARGPRVVAIGGGHGLAVTLRAAREYASSLTAVVSVADDGGSSGRLRATTGLPAMGDIRRCLSSLADPGVEIGRDLERRVDGHALGNLLLVEETERQGSFVAGIAAVADRLRVGATILPVTEVPVVLIAQTDSGEVRGQVAVQGSTGIKRVALEPADPPPAPGVLEAIARADEIVLGPGSLYTSVLAALAVPAVRDAVHEAAARVVYVCNLRPQIPETAGYDVAAHVDALREHGIRPDHVVHQRDGLALGSTDAATIEADIAAGNGLAHDAGKLSRVLRLLGAADHAE